MSFKQAVFHENKAPCDEEVDSPLKPCLVRK